MRETRLALLGTAMLALGLGLGLGPLLPAAAEEAAGEVEAATDRFPQGCVDCHVEGKAETIGALLAAMRHPNVDSDTDNVPGDCTDCHSVEGGYSLLGEFNHILHYENPETNAFVQQYGGDCRYCHTLDAASGDVTLKSGPRNW